MGFESKKCSECGEVKTIDEFHKRKGIKRGVSYVCKTCSKDICSLYYQKNRERIIKKSKEWRESNKDSHFEYDKRYRFKHKEEIKKRRKKYKRENKEKEKRAERLYRKNAVVNLKDVYILHCLKKTGDYGDYNEDVLKGLIKAKREQLQLHRAIKQLKKEIVNGTT